MRDEIKVGIFCSGLLSFCVGLFSFYHPPTWTLHDPSASDSPPRRLFNDAPPPSRFDQFIARYGPPTFEEKSPRGVRPLFTKWLDYEPEHVRVALVAAQTQESLPNPSWVVISFVDAEGTKPISPEEAGRRLMSRQIAPKVGTDSSR